MQDRISAEHVSVELGAEGQLWVNIDGLCAVRVQKVRKIDIQDARNPPLRNRRFSIDNQAALDIHEARVQWNLTDEEFDQLIALEIGQAVLRDDETMVRVK